MNTNINMTMTYTSLLRFSLLLTVVGLSACHFGNTKLDDTLSSIKSIEQTIQDTARISQTNALALTTLTENQFLLEQQLSDIRDTLALQELEDTEPEPDDIKASAQASTNGLSGSIKVNNDLGEKLVLGRVEWVWLPEQKRYFAAQLDTALEFSIIYADDIQRFERNGKKWLRFVVERNNQLTTFEARSGRQQKVNYLGSTRVVRGAVVSLPIVLGEFSDVMEFMVVQKKKHYPQLVLGKNFLTDIAVVDVSQKYRIVKQPDFVKSEENSLKRPKTTPASSK